MGSEIVNRNRDSIFHGDYAGRDLNVTNIIMLEDKEREFVVTHNANIKPVSYFVGRETELQELRQRIEEGRKSVLVSGMGGIGKTHICRKLFEEYLKKHADGGNCPFKHIGYIEYSGDMGDSLQSCLKFKQQDSPENNREAAWRELEYLASDGKLLLFVDNVDRPIGEDSGLQRLKDIPGAVVLTSRQTSFSDEFEPYQIGFLDMEQCKKIYEKIRFEGSRRKIGAKEVQNLEYVIENLAGKHTITVEFLAHLARTKLWTVKRLREELEQKGFRLTFRKNGELVNIQESYELLYDLSILTEAEQNILEAFSVFPYIPLAAETCNQWLLEDAGVSEDDDILMGLYQKGWLQFDIEQESYALHPVFARFIYEKCRPKSEKHSKLLGVSRHWQYMPEKYLLFFENIVYKMNMKEIQIGYYSGEVCIRYGKLADEYEKQRKYGKAEELYKKALRIKERILGEEDSSTATSYNNLARVYKKQGKYKNAFDFYFKAYKIFEYKFGLNNPDTQIAYENMKITFFKWNPEGNLEQWLEEKMKE